MHGTDSENRATPAIDARPAYNNNTISEGDDVQVRINVDRNSHEADICTRIRVPSSPRRPAHRAASAVAGPCQ